MPQNCHTLLVDSHCHLDLAHFDEDRDAILARSKAAGVGIIINPGIDLHHSQQAIALAEEHKNVYAAVGVHPNSSADFSAETVNELRRLAAHPKVVSIGEIGLDYHWDKVEPPQQRIAFEQQLALAAELGLPVIIHCREANDDVSDVLRRWTASTEFRDSALSQRPFAGVLHAFSGDLLMAQEAYSWNFVLSLGGPVTFKNAKELHALVPTLRLDRLMIETDAPYLTPHPHRGQRNEPAYVELVNQRLADLFGISVEQMAKQSTELAHEFFGIRS